MGDKLVAVRSDANRQVPAHTRNGNNRLLPERFQGIWPHCPYASPRGAYLTDNISLEGDFQLHVWGGRANARFARLIYCCLASRESGLQYRGPVRTVNLRIDRVLRRPARGQGLPRQDAQFRFGSVEPAAMSGRKHQLYALG